MVCGKRGKRVAAYIFTVLCAILALLTLVGVMWAGFDIIEEEFSQFPEYAWIHTPVVCLLGFIPIPFAVRIVYTVWRFTMGFTKLNNSSFYKYFQVTFWLAIAQAVVGFALPFTVSQFLHEGNPAMDIAWVAMTVSSSITLLHHQQKIINRNKTTRTTLEPNL
ncbi:hypothetical protein ACFQY8_02310 [Alloscardovia venturai]|uniref:DUF2975 domain-containing protein n=1 Tax=Alloscardovia venturai TaxID=1769421 RepID=A0ABW2Y4C7_9BIFI